MDFQKNKNNAPTNLQQYSAFVHVYQYSILPLKLYFNLGIARFCILYALLFEPHNYSWIKSYNVRQVTHPPGKLYKSSISFGLLAQLVFWEQFVKV